ncbi:hypothetical protein BC826DRAFT_366005 [Russula brevipes]|nr:hypothetical protein BC826DRAFT_366005 [Russula brevipes]
MSVTAYDSRHSERRPRPSASHPPGSTGHDGIGSHMPSSYNQRYASSSISQTRANRPHPSFDANTPPASFPSPIDRGGQYRQARHANVPAAAGTYNDHYVGGRPGSLSSGASTSGSHQLPAARPGPSFLPPPVDQQSSPPSGTRLSANDYNSRGWPGSLSSASGTSTSGSHHPPAAGYNSGGRPVSSASGTPAFESRHPPVAYPRPSPVVNRQDSSPSNARLADAAPLAPEYRTAPIARRDASKANFVTNYVRELWSSVLCYVSKLLLQRRASIDLISHSPGFGSSLSPLKVSFYGILIFTDFLQNERVQVCVTGNKWVIGVILGFGDLVSRVTTS